MKLISAVLRIESKLLTLCICFQAVELLLDHLDLDQSALRMGLSQVGLLSLILV